MKKLLFLMLLVALSSMTVQAIDSGNDGVNTRDLGYFTMPELQIEPGETFVMPVSFTCENSVYSLGFAVSIPEDFEVVSVEKTDRVTGTFQYGTPEGKVNVAIYNLSGAAIDGNDGTIVNITLKATENLSGDYTFTISQGNYGIVGMTGNPQYPEDVSTTVHVNSTPTPGALGYFSMPEIQVEPGETFVLPVSFTCENSVYSLGFAVSIPEGFEVVSVEKTDRVTGTFQYGTPQGTVNVAIYNLSGAAIDGNDGTIVNITLKATENLSGDYTFTISQGNYGIVGMTGNPQYPEDVSTTVHVNNGPTPGALGYFTMPEIEVAPGETFVLPVSFTCENSVYSLGFAVSIPEGFEVVSVEKTDRVTGTFQYGTPEGTVNVAIYNLSGAAIDGNEGVIANITLKATENLSGDYTFTISQGNYGIVGMTGNPQYPEDVSTTVHVNNTPTPGALGYFTMPEIEVEPGETFVLPVSFTCENSVYSLAFGVSIPEGFEVVSVEKTDRVTGTFQYGTPQGTVNVAIYNLSGAAIDGNEGVIVNITLKAAENLSGDYTFTISQGNYGIVGMTGNPQYPEDVSTTVHVNSTPTPGALGYFTMPEIQVAPGETFVLPISFTCEDPIRALGIFTTVPEGFEVISVEPTDRVTGNFMYATPEGECNMAIYSIHDERVIAGNDGVVVNITLKAAEDLSGDYTYTINRSDYGIVGLADSLFPENVSTTIHVGTQAVEGDVNGDNKVNISDVTYLINYLLTQGSTGAYMESADVNHDNKVNISDATYLINYLLTHQ